MFSLKRFDGVAVAQRQTNIVQAAEQTKFAKGLHFKRELLPVGLEHHLPLLINRELVTRMRQAFIHQLLHLRFS